MTDSVAALKCCKLICKKFRESIIFGGLYLDGAIVAWSIVVIVDWSIVVVVDLSIFVVVD